MRKMSGREAKQMKRSLAFLSLELLGLPSAPGWLGSWGGNMKFACPIQEEGPEPGEPQLLPGIQSEQLPAWFLLQGALLAFLIPESPRTLSVSGSRAGSWGAEFCVVFCFSLPA